jgi:regulator of chromosome condensation
MPTRSRSKAPVRVNHLKPKSPISRNPGARSKILTFVTLESPPPSLKRARSATTLNGANAPNGATKAINRRQKADTIAVPLPKKLRKTASVTKSPINVVPEFPAKMDPPALIFVWGTGNFGQFGMGPSFLDELPKPTRNTWVEEKIGQGVFGPRPNSGIVGVAAGGLHTLFIDESGTVCSFLVSDLAKTHQPT